MVYVRSPSRLITLLWKDNGVIQHAQRALSWWRHIMITREQLARIYTLFWRRISQPNRSNICRYYTSCSNSAPCIHHSVHHVHCTAQPAVWPTDSYIAPAEYRLTSLYVWWSRCKRLKKQLMCYKYKIYVRLYNIFVSICDKDKCDFHIKLLIMNLRSQNNTNR